MPSEKILDFEKDWQELIESLDLGDLPYADREALLKSLFMILIFN